jgi:type I restriction enzyme M protein
LTNFRAKTDFLWSLAELLRGDYKQSEYGKVILPLVVLRRLDCVLEPTKQAVLTKHGELQAKGIANVEPILKRAAGEQFYNVSPLDFPKLLGDAANVADNLRAYIAGFSSTAHDVIEKFKFEEQIDRLEKADLLYLLVQRFVEVDLHPEAISNLEMGYMFEELIRRFSEQSNETAGEHFTPREVVRLMVNLLFIEDDELLRTPGTVRTLYDPACGTGGMLSVAQDYLRDLNPNARLEVFGQELNEESYAICRSDMMLKGQDASRIHVGNSFTRDGVPNEQFDYMLSNPPFGVEWKKVEDQIRKEHEQLGFKGRFGAGLPRINDGSLLFLQHMTSKMRPVEKGGSRLAIVFNGSPLFTGAAGSGESEIRRWLLENDFVEAIVALPDQLFYNTGIHTYIWIVTNRKPAHRKGKTQLIDARSLYRKMRRSLGDKRNELAEEHIAEITSIFKNFDENERSLILDNEAFGYQRIVIERPLRLRYELSEAALAALDVDKAFLKLGPELRQHVRSALAASLDTEAIPATTDAAAFTEAVAAVVSEAPGEPKQRSAAVKTILAAVAVRDPEASIVLDGKGRPMPDPECRDSEMVPLHESIDDYFEREVEPHLPDAWVDHAKTKTGYEIPLTRHFHRFEEPRPLEEIDAEIRTLEEEILDLLSRVAR